MSLDHGKCFERRLANQFDQLAQVTEEVLRFLEVQAVAGPAAYGVQLTVEELVTNILKYGYDDAAPHQILLQLEVQPGVVRLAIEDDGHEFNPLTAPEPNLEQPLEDRLPGGLGLHLIREMAHDLKYERTSGRNRVTVWFKTGAS
jgi:anti-sigma regulatory factor (Ser/Thr protein kinase)